MASHNVLCQDTKNSKHISMKHNEIMSSWCFPPYCPFVRESIDHQWILRVKGPLMQTFDIFVLLCWTSSRVLDAMPLIPRHCNMIYTYLCVMTSHTALWHHKQLLHNRFTFCLNNGTTLRTQLTSIKHEIPTRYSLFVDVDMTTLSNGNIFCVTGPLWMESIDQRWIRLTKASVDVFFYLRLNKRLSKKS